MNAIMQKTWGSRTYYCALHCTMLAAFKDDAEVLRAANT